MKILVTGGLGFIGTNYIRYILDTTEHEVVNYDAITYAGNPANHAEYTDCPRYQFVHGDITDQSGVCAAMEGVDAVVHFAAESHVDRSISDSLVFAKTNVIGTLVLLDAALQHRVGRFHHVSTDEVFGTLDVSGSFNEQTPYQPRSPYAASKASSDHFVRAYYHTHQLPVTISNCSNNYGPYQNIEKLIPLTISRVLEGKEVPVYGTGENVRDWIYVEDHVKGIQCVIERGIVGQTYCFGGASELSNLDVVNKIITLMDADKSLIKFVPDRKGHDYRYAIDNTKVEDVLGWSPVHDFDTSLQATVDWYKANRDWWQS